MSPVLHLVAESVGTQHGVGVDDAPRAHDGVLIQDGVGKDGHLGTDPAPGHDVHAGMDRGALADLHVVVDRGAGVNLDAAAQLAVGAQEGRQAHPDVLLRPGRLEVSGDKGKRPMYVVHADVGPIDGGEVAGNDVLEDVDALVLYVILTLVAAFAVRLFLRVHL